METGALAAREQIAGERVSAAALTLGERFGLADQAEALAHAGHKVKQVSALFRAEAVADLLEALEQATAGQAGAESEPAVLSGTVGAVQQRVDQIEDQVELEALLHEEQADKNRAGVTNAIEARLQVLGAAQNEREAEEVAAPPPDVSALDGNVQEVTAFLAGVELERDLVAFEYAERAGKSRMGVLQAIAERRAALKG